MGIVFYRYSLSNLIFFFLFSTIIVSGKIRMLLRKLLVQAQEKVGAAPERYLIRTGWSPGGPWELQVWFCFTEQPHCLPLGRPLPTGTATLSTVSSAPWGNSASSGRNCVLWAFRALLTARV